MIKLKLDRITIGKSLFLLIFNVIAYSTLAQPLQLEWAKGLFSTKTSFTSLDISDSEIDADGNMIVTGYFQGTVDIDPGPAVVNITSEEVGFGKSEVFMAKYNSAGEFLFGFKMDKAINIKKVLISTNNDIYILGDFNGIIDFNPGAGVNTLDGIKNRFFVVKFNAAGEYLSGYGVGEENGFANLWHAKIDANNNLFLYGSYKDTIDMDPSNNVKNLIAKDEAVFLAKYSNKNKLLFAFGIECHTSSVTTNMDLDASGQVYISGSYFPKSGDLPLDLDPGVNNTNLNGIGGVDGFWAKYSNNGDYLAGYLYDGNIRNIKVDPNNNIYIIGSTTNEMDVDLSSKKYLLYTDAGGFDQFLVKYNANFDLKYGMTFRGNSYEMRIEEMQVDHRENVYLCGQFKDTIGFVKSSNTGDVISKGSDDAFFSKFDKDGKLQFAHSFGNTGKDVAHVLTLDLEGKLWMAGSFNDSIDMDVNGNTGLISNPADGGAVFLTQYIDPQAVGISNIDEQENRIYILNKNLWIDFNKQEMVNAKITVVGINGQEYLSLNEVKNRVVKIPLSSLPQQQVFIVQVENQDSYSFKKFVLK